MRTVSCLIAGAAAMLLLGGAVGATTYYVDDGAAPGGTGGEADPLQTIQQGIGAANPAGGDTVIVLPGTYNEHVSFQGKAVTVRSTDPNDPGAVAATIIDGTASGPVVTFADGETPGAVLQGFTVRNGRWDSTAESRGGGVHIDGASPSVLDNVITSNFTKTDGGGICILNDASPQIMGNTLSGNTAEGWGGGIFAFGDTSDPNNVVNAEPQIIRNRVTGNSAGWDGGGIACFEACEAFLKSNVVDNNASGMAGGGVFSGFGVATNCENLTLADNEALGSDVIEASGSLPRAGRGGGLACWFSGQTVVNSCILWGNAAKDDEGAELALVGTGQAGLYFSCVGGGQAGAYTEAESVLSWGSGNISYDPLFSPVEGDYHLQSLVGRYNPATGLWEQDAHLSSCIDGGSPVLAYDLEPAPHGGRVNRGGYGNMPEASLSGTLFDITLSFVDEWDWTYQNTELATEDRHKVVLSVSVSNDWNGNSTYYVTVTKTGGAGDVVVQPTANPLVVNLLGGRHGVGGTGPVELNVYVAGNIGGAASANTAVVVRPLGDVDGSGEVTAIDKQQMNKRLNGTDTGLPDRVFDLTGADGINAVDKQLMNNIMNGVTID